MITTTNLYNYKAEITNVVDGDTVDAVIDLGFRMSATHRLRLLGINAPEKNSSDPLIRAQALKSRDALCSYLVSRDVTIHTEKSDAFGRYLAIIYVGDLNVNEAMVRNGFAVPFK